MAHSQGPQTVPPWSTQHVLPDIDYICPQTPLSQLIPLPPRQGPYSLNSKVTPSSEPPLIPLHPTEVPGGATGLMVKDDGGSTIRGKGNFILISRRFLSP